MAQEAVLIKSHKYLDIGCHTGCHNSLTVRNQQLLVEPPELWYCAIATPTKISL